MPAREEHDCAVAFCCDGKFLPLALFMIWQLAHHNPHRRFDIVISTWEDLDLPAWAKALGVTIHRTGPLPDLIRQAPGSASLVPLYRFSLARELGDRYRRILYLDSDMFVDGGDINRLLAVDLGPHPLGAVLDAPFLYESNYLAKEFARLSLPALPYANAGVLLIDTGVWQAQEVERQLYETVRAHPAALVYLDQSMLNIALRGKFAQLAPCWNWQNNDRLDLVNHCYPVFLRHFIGRMKPDRYAGRRLNARYNQAYRAFLEQFLPEHLSRVVQAADTTPLTLREVGRMAMEHLLARRVAAAELARHPDPYVAIL